MMSYSAEKTRENIFDVTDSLITVDESGLPENMKQKRPTLSNAKILKFSNLQQKSSKSIEKSKFVRENKPGAKALTIK